MYSWGKWNIFNKTLLTKHKMLTIILHTFQMSQNTNTKNDNTTLSQFWQANLLPHTQFPCAGKHPWSLGNLDQFLLTKLRNLHVRFTAKYLAAAFVWFGLTRPLSKRPSPPAHTHNCSHVHCWVLGLVTTCLESRFPSKLPGSSFSFAYKSYNKHLVLIYKVAGYTSHPVTGTELSILWVPLF